MLRHEAHQGLALDRKMAKKNKVNIVGEVETFNPKKMKSFYGWDGDVLVLNVLGTPSAKKDAIGKPKGTQLKISVKAAPVAGKATDYMVRFLAKEFGVAKNDIEVVFGRMNVNKQLRIKAPTKLPRSIAQLEK
ncbi:MAG: hypothetical protein methR_P1159 [Methyloprofundus sp.]|nr:MAG: hypothetical protein methR_P1159 [Methyloprofundus sp.]